MRRASWLIGVIAAVLVVAWIAIARRVDNSIVVYCTHDLVYAEPVLEEFTQRTGIRVTVVGDTEATKSLGLIERLLKEGPQSPCDLVWNNEVLGTIRLQRAGLLQPVELAEHRVPEAFRDPGGTWFGFAGRLRVWIAREDSPATSLRPAMLDSLWASPGTPNDSATRATDLSRLAIAKPLYGTTFSQFALLWHLRGAEATQTIHRTLVDRQCRFVAGNAMSRDVVVEGSCDLGMTDTDDLFAALDAGHKVTMEPIRIDGRTICIPNTVAILRSTDRPAEARRLIEYLLSEEVELQLARTARQIPLGPVDRSKIPTEVQPLTIWADESWNIAAAADAAAECLPWLKAEYAR